MFKIGDRVRYYVSSSVGTVEGVNPNSSCPYVIRWDHAPNSLLYYPEEHIISLNIVQKSGFARFMEKH